MSDSSHHLSSIKNSYELEYHNVIRDYIKHEDDLINQRINWQLTIQGFLLATFSLTLQKVVEIQEKFQSDCAPDKKCLFLAVNQLSGYRPLIWLCPLLCVLGVVIAFCSHFGISAARKAIKRLHEDWNYEVRGFQTHHHWGEKNREDDLYLPDVIRGGCGHRKMHEHFQMFGTCWIFVCGWAIAAAFLMNFLW